jgi:hypothetical protein
MGSDVHPGCSSTAKYWIWVAASLNFIVPLGAVLDKLWASHLSWAAPLGTIGDLANSISRGPVAAILRLVWLLGAMLTRFCLRIRAARRDAQAAAGQCALDLGSSFLARASQ